VDVHVDVGVPAATAVAADPMPHVMAAPGLTFAAPVPLPSTPDEEVVRSRRTLFEFGPMLSPLTGGAEAEIAFPISQRIRLGAMGALNALFTHPDQMLYIGAGELRYVGSGRQHNDIGLLGGVATPGYEPAAFVGFRLERVWEGAAHGIGLSLNPVLA